MDHSPKLAAFVLAVASLSTTACAGPLDPEGLEEEAVTDTSQAVRIGNALTSNALTSNALTSNALTAEALTSGALTSSALRSNPRTAKALSDPASRTLLKYIAGCALPAGERLDVAIDGAELSFPGELGLATGWAEEGGACDGACRSWISACVLARVNYLGQRVDISLRGDRAELQPDKAERLAFDAREATYFGDIFAAEPRYHACLPPGATAIPRVCGPSLDTCAIEVVGACDRRCGAPDGDGSFPDCRATIRDGSRTRTDREVSHPGSITVFLQ